MWVRKQGRDGRMPVKRGIENNWWFKKDEDRWGEMTSSTNNNDRCSTCLSLYTRCTLRIIINTLLCEIEEQSSRKQSVDTPVFSTLDTLQYDFVIMMPDWFVTILISSSFNLKSKEECCGLNWAYTSNSWWLLDYLDWWSSVAALSSASSFRIPGCASAFGQVNIPYFQF